jgi:imidazolonepropionase-like amidohydrolase
VDPGPLGGEPSTSTTAFVNVNVIPMTGDVLLPEQTVVVANGSIVEVGLSSSTTVPADAEVIDGAGAYLLPGLADMHVHLRDNWPVSQLDLFLASGVTTVRSLDGAGAFVLSWRDEINAGTRRGPTIVTSGPVLDGRLVDPELAVQQQVAQGYDFLKLYSYLTLQGFRDVLSAARQLGAYTVGHIPYAVGLNNAVVQGMNEIAHVEELTWEFVEFDRNVGLDASEWLPYLIGLIFQQFDVPGGFNDAEFLATFGDSVAVITARLSSARMPVATTLSVDSVIVQKLFAPDAFLARHESQYLPEAYRTSFLQGTEKHQVQFAGIEVLATYKYAFDRLLVRELHAAGVALVVGTDCGTGGMGIVPGFSIHDELQILTANGFTQYEAIAAATVEASRVMESITGEDAFGTIEVGKRADLLLLSQNPLQDIATLRQPRGVMARGVWYSSGHLQGMLALTGH